MEEANKKSQELAPAPKRDVRGQFVKGSVANPRGRGKGNTCRALRLARDLAEKVALPRLGEAAEAGDVDACRVLVAYGLPRQKPVQVPEKLPLPQCEGLADAVRGLVPLVAEGKISLEAATAVAGILAQAARVEEVECLREEVEALRTVLDARPVPDAPPKAADMLANITRMAKAR